jgi:hypothetical protein
VEACEPGNKKADIGVREIGVPESGENAEMPVGEGAVAESVKNAQYHPESGFVGYY